jgi:phosphatidylserine/phosphatidylglycerophosphate/cardiolipin synthase-like enzyme
MMKRFSLALAIFVLITINLLACFKSVQAPAELQCSVRVYFSPKGGCQDAVVKEIGNAKETILLQAYTFTSKEIGKALVDAKNRGVKVQCVLDGKGSDAKGSQKGLLNQSKIAVRLDKKHQIMHDKVIIIDGKIVITGSYNFTNAAENDHAENLLVITGEDVAKAYTQHWQEHWEHSDEMP